MKIHPHMHNGTKNLAKSAIRVLVCLALLICGCRVSKPGEVESRVAKEVKHKVTVGGKDVQNPLPPTEENIGQGREHFGHHCAICHGLDGQTSGVPFADKMSPAVPDLASKDVQDYTDGQLKWIVDNGIDPSGMPAWKGNLSDDEMWKIVHFIRHLPAKGSLEIPAVYKQEYEEHERTHGQHQHAHSEKSAH